MKMEELFKHTFKSLRQQIEAQRTEGCRWWQQRQGTASDFCRAMVANGYMTDSQLQQAAQRYRLGVGRDGAVIFWQIDECDLLRDGKIMHYRPDGHRDHDRKPTWASYLMRKSGRLPQYWNTDHCLFGLHLLKDYQTHPRPLPEWRGVDTSSAYTSTSKSIYAPPSQGGGGGGSLSTSKSIYAPPSQGGGGGGSLSTSKSIYAPPSQGGGGGGSVCIVEAEKTAVIMSAIRPEYLWLATGGKTELSVARLSPLQGRRIILFPDTDETGQTYRDWYAIAEAAASVFDHPVTVSSILEQRATPAQRTAKIDIADLIYNE